MNKKVLNSLFAGVFLVGLVSPNLSFSLGKNIQRAEERIENRLENENPGLGVLERKEERAEERLEKMLGKRAEVIKGKIVGIEGTTLTVSDDDTTYTVLTDLNTKFRRKFWGKSSLEEFSVNDLVNVVGKWADDEKTQINALVVRNLSIQKRYGVFFGTVSEISGNQVKIQTAQKGELTIEVSLSTKLYDRVMKTIKIADIKVGHRIRVRGLWDGIKNSISEITQIKDFSIPEVSSSPVAD